jgi:hypothetical protein
MADLFNQDFQDFIEALNREAVEYMLVGGYLIHLIQATVFILFIDAQKSDPEDDELSCFFYVPN